MVSPEGRNYNIRRAEQDRERQRDLESWRQDGSSSGGGMPCGCLFTVMAAFAAVFLCCVGGQTVTERCAEKSAVECVRTILLSSGIAL